MIDLKTDELELAKKHYWNQSRIKTELFHISSNFAIYRYIRHIDTIEGYLPKGRHVLDWGSGVGHMSLFLKHRGYRVTAFDIFKKFYVYDDIGVRYVRGRDRLPFKPESFDAVLSCGVLEHVRNDVYSLRQIHRVLKKNGLLFILNLPQKYSLSEYIGRHTRLGGHWHIYGRDEIVGKLKKTGYEIVSIRLSHFLPTHVLRVNMKSVHGFYDTHYKTATQIDRLLERTPLLNTFSNEWEIVAKKI